ncbi:MAG: hypothetical protein MUE44_11175 [Oscillatoriaceae cyanobacterium Prado104]|nr:hypothetical protein [Oscillatoriaceae cyanobacterium Prado104]
MKPTLKSEEGRWHSAEGRRQARSSEVFVLQIASGAVGHGCYTVQFATNVGCLNRRQDSCHRLVNNRFHRWKGADRCQQKKSTLNL